MSALATVARKGLMVNLLQKLIVTIADADIGNLKSLHKLFDKCLDHMLVKLVQNRMVQTYKILFFLTKKFNNL